MFDDVNNQGKQTVPGGTQEPIDIFSEADASVPAAGEIMEEGVKAGFPTKIVAIIAGVVVIAGVAGFGVYQFVLKKPAPAPAIVEDVLSEEQPVTDEEASNTEGVANDQQPAEEPIQGTTAIPNQDGQIVPAPVPPLGDPSAQIPPSSPVTTNPAPTLDSDGDGLTDEEETRFGTDKNVVDTDNDGLSDREEMQVYKTNPVNPDSDGDGFSDGTEIKNGFNPNGSGKLITVPSEQSPAPSPVLQ